MRINSCLTFIHRHIGFMRPDQIFTTGECLVYGKRSNVDNSLSRCVQDGLIVRLTRGVFMRRTAEFEYPSELQIAIAKAARFGKELLTHAVDTCAKYGVLPKGNNEPTYYVDGSTSRFLYRGTYINLRKASKKRMHMRDDRVGLAIRALWIIGKKTIQQRHIDKVSHLWSLRTEKEKILKGKAWMPSWLGDRFLTSQYMGPFGPGMSKTLRGP